MYFSGDLDLSGLEMLKQIFFFVIFNPLCFVPTTRRHHE